ncbi:hypothetical protein BC477_13395 [Clavibacter michiganensis subsp. michiganensis]|uniref:Uncharacterized protein n=1 Tax=Clavibacter michiganensis subsp. michiganensis TaxID=33013 RepID=A0A251XJH6_CLAMM|nr:hypothetical protein BC477_13395 [Clavibacter michiganensis subsp. michiganensis]OUE02791.1 hypothetical protein CMMCAS07_12300 [Clavibacter michiganensis subsp. michiganensis]
MSSRMAAYVSVRDSGSMPSSSRKPTTSSPPCQPPAYCPRAVAVERSFGRRTADSTFSFSSRRLDASNATGSSMAVRARSCRRWFWITSRAAPMPS